MFYTVKPLLSSHTFQLFSVLISDSVTDPGFFLGAGAILRYGVIDW